MYEYINPEQLVCSLSLRGSARGTDSWIFPSAPRRPHCHMRFDRCEACTRGYTRPGEDAFRETWVDPTTRMSPGVKSEFRDAHESELSHGDEWPNVAMKYCHCTVHTWYKIMPRSCGNVSTLYPCSVFTRCIIPFFIGQPRFSCCWGTPR